MYLKNNNNTLSLADRVYLFIWDMVLQHEIKCGEKIPEQKIATN